MSNAFLKRQIREYKTTTTVTLTINGALEDTIVIRDASNNIIGSCVFPTNSTSGSCIVEIDPNTEYTFISSVTVNPDNWSQSFSIKKILSNSATQTVNAYPNNALIWYGNQVVPFGAYADFYYASSAFAAAAPSVSMNGRQIMLSCPSGGGWRSYDFRTVNKVNISNFTSFKIKGYRMDSASAGAATNGYIGFVSRQSMSGYYQQEQPILFIDGSTGTGNQIISWSASSGKIGSNAPYSGEYYICIWVCPNWQQYTDNVYIEYLVLA